MQSRKLIKFGNSSHVISIPSSWLSKNNLNKGDTIFLKENGDNELVITPGIQEVIIPKKEITINTKNKPLSTIKREIVSAYTNNYNSITIVDKLGKKRNKIEKVLNSLLALEIIAESPNKIIVKDFLNIKDLSMTSIVRRVDTILRVMMDCLENKDKKDLHKCYKEIYQMDKNINKLRFLTYRVVKSAFSEYKIYNQLDENYTTLLDIRLIIENLENMADECKRISRFKIKCNFNKAEEKEFLEIFSDIKHSYIDIMNSYYKKDKNLAHKIASQRVEHIKRCNEFLEVSKKKEIASIVEKLKGIESFIRAIARIVIDEENE